MTRYTFVILLEFHVESCIYISRVLKFYGQRVLNFAPFDVS